MVRKTAGYHRKTRHKLRRRRRTPPATVSRMLQIFHEGDRVVIDIHPSVQRGRPHPRFNGLIGTIVGKQGLAYYVRVRDGNSYKKILALPIHLKKVA
jgi:large subunit ribosomal protein L21e